MSFSDLPVVESPPLDPLSWLSRESDDDDQWASSDSAPAPGGPPPVSELAHDTLKVGPLLATPAFVMACVMIGGLVYVWFLNKAAFVICVVVIVLWAAFMLIYIAKRRSARRRAGYRLVFTLEEEDDDTEWPDDTL